MEIIFLPSARKTILSIIKFIDDLNTIGAGERWYDKLIIYCNKYALPNVQYSLCNNKGLAKRKLSCIVFNNWIIAFTIEEDTFIIHHVIYGRLLK
jgi:hypothetical protein